jgi:hypothetical protein
MAPKMEGRSMSMVLSPNTDVVKKAQQAKVDAQKEKDLEKEREREEKASSDKSEE